MNKQKQDGCGGQCSCCSLHERIDTGGLRGWRLVGLCMLAFLVPLAAGTVAAVLMRGDATRQAFGIYGVLAAVLLLQPAVIYVVKQMRQNSRGEAQ